MEIITKQQAIEIGLKYYFTGKPCKHGHLEKRPVKTGVCLECLRLVSKRVYADKKSQILARQKKYRIENQDVVKETFKRYYEKNKEQRSIAYAEYRAENKDKERDRHKKYRSENYEKIKAREKEYRINNPEKVRVKHANRRALLNSAEGRHNASDIKRIFDMQKWKCAGCATNLSNYHVDHITPLSKGGSNWPSNLQILCPACNLNKHAKDPFDWANERGLLI